MQKEKMTHGAHDPKMAILGLEPPRRKIWALYSKHNIPMATGNFEFKMRRVPKSTNGASGCGG